MPCDAIATVRTRIRTRAGKEIFADESAQEALQRLLNLTYGSGWTISRAARSVAFVRGNDRVVIEENGEVATQLAWLGNVQPEVVRDLVEKIGQALTTRRVAEAISRRYRVTDSQTVGQATVITFEL